MKQLKPLHMPVFPDDQSPDWWFPFLSPMNIPHSRELHGMPDSTAHIIKILVAC